MIYLRIQRTRVVHIKRQTRGRRSLCGLIQGSDGPMVDYRPYGYRVCELCVKSYLARKEKDSHGK